MRQSNLESKNNSINKISSNRLWFMVVVLILPLMTFAKAVSAEEAKPGMHRTPLIEHAVELTNKKVNAKVMRVTFPAGFKSPLHTHEGPGPRYVVKGSVKVSENGKEGTYAAGEVFWESGHEMQIENIGTESAELIIFELAPQH